MPGSPLRPLLLALALLAAVPPVRAQPRNAAVLGRLAADCLADVPPDAFVLDAPTLTPYLHAALVARWQANGRRPFADTLAAYPRLHIGPATATVAYARAGRRRWNRTVTLALPFTLLRPDGEILRADVCGTDAADVVPARSVATLEDPTYPETIGRRPAPGWVARYAEPVLLGSAVVVSTLLFFSLRSR